MKPQDKKGEDDKWMRKKEKKSMLCPTYSYYVAQMGLLIGLS